MMKYTVSLPYIIFGSETTYEGYMYMVHNCLVGTLFGPIWHPYNNLFPICTYHQIEVNRVIIQSDYVAYNTIERLSQQSKQVEECEDLVSSWLRF